VKGPRSWKSQSELSCQADIPSSGRREKTCKRPGEQKGRKNERDKEEKRQNQKVIQTNGKTEEHDFVLVGGKK